MSSMAGWLEDDMMSARPTGEYGLVGFPYVYSLPRK